MPSALATQPARAAAAEPAQVLSGAVMRAAELLGVNQASLAQCLGLSPATVSRLARGEYLLAPERKEWELATLFVRLFRSLDSIVGSKDGIARAWLTGENLALAGRPVELIRSAEGLVRVTQYLDAARGRI